MAKSKPTQNAPYKGQQTQVGSVVSHQQPSHSQVFTQTQQVTTIFDPDVLRKYSEMVPNAPERVLVVFEKNSDTERALQEALIAQQKAASDMQANAMNYQAADNKRRDWMAFGIIIAGLIASGVFAYLKTEWLSGVTLVAIIGYAVAGYLQKQKKPDQ
jgi:uncharacterized membrane protein